MIEFDDVSFAYRAPAEGAGAPEGVRGIDLRVEAGRCVLVCGASGCGKTTVTRLANGLAPSFFPGTLEGRVLVDGRDVADLESWEVAACVGSVFQNPRTQFFNVDSTGEVAFSLESMAWPEERIRERTHDTIRQLGLEELADRSIFSLSGGEKQRIAYASSWAPHPANLVLDEPTSNLDEAAIAALRRYLLDAKAQGAAVLVAEHRLWWLADVADEVVVMEEGRIARRFDGATFRALPSSEVRDLGLRVRALADERARERRAPGDAREPRAPLVRLRGVHASYGKREVLHGVDLDLREGEVAALVGANGAGKSTLCRTIVGLHRESAGTTTIDGEPAGPTTPARLLDGVPGRELPAVRRQRAHRSELRADGRWRRQPAARVDEVLDGLGLAAYAERHPPSAVGRPEAAPRRGGLHRHRQAPPRVRRAHERARPGQHAHGGGARAPVGRRGPRRARGHP